MLLTRVLVEAATTSWPPWRRMATVFEPIRPVPPMTTIFMVFLPCQWLATLECKFVGRAKRAVELVAAHALLGGAEQERRQPPLAERDLGTLEDGSDRDGELALAGVA